MKDSFAAGTVNQHPPHGWVRLLLQLPVLLYRLKVGWLFRRRLLLLTHTGRKSGKAHATVLELLDFDQNSHCCIIASDWGVKSQWFKNVLQDPRVRYTVGLRERVGRAEQLPITQAERQLRNYGDRHRTAIRIRMKFLICEQFDGSSAQYSRLATQVPVLRLLPDRDDDDSA